MSKYYVVRKGKKPGIYFTWSECQENIKGYSGAEFKSFTNETEAIAYCEGVELPKAQSKIIPVTKVNECNVFINGFYDINRKVSSIAILLETFNKNYVFYGSFYIKEEDIKGSNITSEIVAAYLGLKIAVERNYDIIRLYSHTDSIVKWAEHDWTPKDRLKFKFCDYCDYIRLGKDEDDTLCKAVSFFVNDSEYNTKKLKEFLKRGIYADSYFTLEDVLADRVSENNLYRM